MIDTWRTRRAPGGSLPIRHSGTDGKFGKHSEGGLEVYRIGSRLELRDAWRTRTTSGKMVSARHSGQVSPPEGWSGRGGFRQRLRKEAFGTGSGWFRKAYRSGFGDTCQLPKGLRKVWCFGWFPKRGFRKGLLRRVAQGR